MALAQENATINGTVTDPTGAVVPNASVTLVLGGTGVSKTAPTNSAGFYNFPGLAIGTYTISATAPGFKKFSRTGVVLNTAQTLEENVTLEVGSEGQTVTVQADALQVQAETNEVSSLITGKQVTQLATNGRNITALAVLGMGVSATLPDYNGVNALTAGNAISFNGTRPTHNDYLIDGGEIYDRGCGGCYSILPSDDAIAQFQTLDSNYAPDYGIASGGQILMVLRSGTRNFHGGLWYFNRNEAFNASSYISKLNGQPKPELRLNLFGANIGGPLFIPHVYNASKDRTFFFWNEEWRRQIIGSAPTVLPTIPTADFPTAGQPLTYSLPAGSKTNPIVPVTQDPAKLALYAADGLTPGQPFPNNTIPANLIDKNAVLFMGTGAFPKPNGANNTYVASIAAPTNVREDLVRIDHKINEKYQLMGHYIHDAVVQDAFPPLWGSGNYPTVGSVMNNPAWTAVIKLTQTLSPNLLNETMFSMDGNKLRFTPTGVYAQPSGFTPGTFFTGNNALNRLPEIDLGTPYGKNWSSQYFPWKNAAFGYQTRDDISITRGHHSLKFGAGWLHFIKNQQLQANTQGTFSFQAPAYSGDSYVNFLLGFASSYTQLQALNTDHWVNDTYSFYGLDNWHITNNLTLNLGLRYDALPHAFERYNRFANFLPSKYSPSAAAQFNTDGSLNQKGPGFVTPPGFTTAFYLNGMGLAGQNGVPRGQVKNYWGTWGPRVGFAYDLSGNGKTVVRGGFGLFVERIQGNDVYNAGINQPFSNQPQANNVYLSNATQSNQTGATTSAPSFPANITNLAYTYPIPTTAQFSLGIQREVARSVVAVLQYVGTSAWHQSDDRSINTLPLNSPQRQFVAAGKANANLYRFYPGYSNITQEETTTNSSYNSFQAGIRMENRHDLTFQLAYTYSHEIDLVSNDLNRLSNPFNPAYDRGSGAFDRRHIFNANYIYSIPFLRNSDNVLARETLGGWQLAGITTANTGTPANVTYGTDVLGLGGNVTNRPNLVQGVSPRGPKTQKEYFNTSAFSAPVAPWAGGANQGFGSAGKDSAVGPGRLNFNISLYKNFALGKGDQAPHFEFRAESFNTFNHTQFQNVDLGYTDGNFGQVTTTWDPRVFQFGAKFLF
ncbi:MAG TPA: carboxypeptidase regulatory-like domain-containing protein [Acidobacteriaceae bacterium]|nr:carboxypeptidase regulatory-like domain-containing protein [Acidobacteriaceae bacterium]